MLVDKATLQLAAVWCSQLVSFSGGREFQVHNSWLARVPYLASLNLVNFLL